jgi:uncharacterized RDD family membrane protein YckC
MPTEITPSSASSAGRVVTAEALTVAPGVLGRPLAGPGQRFAAMVTDLVAVGLLSLLSGPWLGLGTGVMLIVLFGNSRTAPLPLKAVRLVCRVLGAIIVFLSVLALGHVSLLRNSRLQLDVFTGRPPSPAMKTTVYVAPDASAAEVRQVVQQLEKQVEELKAENRELHEVRRSWVHQARAFTTTLGVTFGWSGVYFTLLAGAWGGRTLGKVLLRTRAVKINGTPFTFFDAFVRHGGYVAGVAMGLTGFLKLLWEPNRQAVEDRIASTVVIKVS